MSRKDKGRFNRTFQKMRDEYPNVKIIDVAKECEITNVSYRTFIRTLNDAGYRWLKCRRKGLLSADDRKHRVRIARAALRKYDKNIWTDEALLHLDCFSFRHNHRPYHDAVSARGKMWRKSKEGLKYTGKGSKNLPGGRTLHLLVEISHSIGVIVAEEYEKLNGSWFTQFAHRTLQKVLMDYALIKYKEKVLFVMDNDQVNDVQQRKMYSTK